MHCLQLARAGEHCVAMINTDLHIITATATAECQVNKPRAYRICKCGKHVQYLQKELELGEATGES